MLVTWSFVKYVIKLGNTLPQCYWSVVRFKHSFEMILNEYQKKFSSSFLCSRAVQLIWPCGPNDPPLAVTRQCDGHWGWNGSGTRGINAEATHPTFPPAIDLSSQWWPKILNLATGKECVGKQWQHLHSPFGFQSCCSTMDLAPMQQTLWAST